MAISSIGVGSNLPLAQLLDNLRASQEGRLTAIETRKNGVTSQITAYGQLKSELTNLSNAAKALNKDAFGSMKTTVTGSDFTANAINGAIAGQYDISVGTLARAQSLVMTGQPSRSDNIGTGGQIRFTINGQAKELDLSATGTSLDDIVAAINRADDLGLQATILNNGSDLPHQLVITSKKTGTEAAISTISVIGNAALNDVLGFGHTGSTVTESAATNASFTLNGVAITSQSNTVTDILDGVTFSLTGATGQANRLSISADEESVMTAIKAFVDRFNDVHKKLKQVTTYDAETLTASALTGDSIARNIQSRLSSILNTTSSGGAFSMLSEIGIRTDPKTGLLQIDDARLRKALTEKPQDVQALFRGDTGVAQKAMEVASVFTDSRDGLLVSASNGASARLKDLEKQYTSTEERIDAQMEIYRRQFTAMDSLLAQLNSTSSFLTQQLSRLGSKNT